MDRKIIFGLVFSRLRYNAYGTEGSSLGDGGRCIAAFARD